jgi:pyruvate,water dikinase
MGVVVQLMVPADTAGVLFTWHPLTGDPRQMLITANFGLGEVCAYNLEESMSV